MYISTDSAPSWKNAEDDCRERGGHLAVPTNLKMNNDILHAIRQRKIVAVWIGVYRKSGTMFHEVGGEEIFFKNWEPSEPNNSGGQENCVELRDLPYFTITGGWNDRPCSIDRHYVCQRCL